MNTVLVVEDELIIRKGIKKIVEQYSGKRLNVYCASNGVEALEILSEQAIHIVITDIRMPKMDGLGLCEQLSRHYPNIQVIVISGYDDFNYAKEAIGFGVREYLLKPVYPSDLHAVLHKLIAEWEIGMRPFSLSKYEDWMEETEIAIWQLDMGGIQSLLQHWNDHCRESGYRLDHLALLLKDCLDNIRKRMLKRSFNVQAELPEEMEEMTGEMMLEHFNSQLLEIVDELARMRGAKFRDPFEEVKAYIDSHLSEEITLDMMAEHVGMSPTYFSHLFKKEMTETFVQYRIRKRMEKAVQLMEIPHYRIIDICQAVGYIDYPHFTKTFKKFTGYSPSEYRKKMGIN